MITRKILNNIKMALSISIETDNVEDMSRQTRALILAMADHIEALEKERAKQNLFKRYRGAS